jgi:hypothetical protein
MQEHAVSDEDDKDEQRREGRSGHGRDNSLLVAMMVQRRRPNEFWRYTKATTLTEPGVAAIMEFIDSGAHDRAPLKQAIQRRANTAGLLVP